MQEQDLYVEWCPKNGTVYFMESVEIPRDWGVGERVRDGVERRGKWGVLNVYVVDLKVFVDVYVDWIGYRKFSKTLRTYV